MHIVCVSDHWVHDSLNYRSYKILLFSFISKCYSVELPFLSSNTTDAVSEELPGGFNKVVATTQPDKAMSSLQPDSTEDFLFGDIYIMHPLSVDFS